jgi:WD40 repeat protein
VIRISLDTGDLEIIVIWGEVGEIIFDFDLHDLIQLGYDITQVHCTLTHQDTGRVVETDLTWEGENASGVVSGLEVGSWDLKVDIFENGTLVCSASSMGLVDAETAARVELLVQLELGQPQIELPWFPSPPFQVMPDLKPLNYTSPPSAEPGEVIGSNVSVDVTNTAGTADAGDGSITVAFYLSTIWLWTGSGTLLMNGSVEVPTPIESGETIVVNVPSDLAIPVDTQPGSYYLFVVVDEQKEIPEGSEFNNAIQNPITISQVPAKIAYVIVKREEQDSEEAGYYLEAYETEPTLQFLNHTLITQGVFFPHRIATYDDPNSDGNVDDRQIFVLYREQLYCADTTIKIERFDGSTLASLGVTDPLELNGCDVGFVVDQEKKLVYVVNHQRAVRIFDADTLALVDEVQFLSSDEPIDDLCDSALDEVNDWLFLADGDRSIHYFDTTTWDQVDTIRLSNMAVDDVSTLAVDDTNSLVYTWGLEGSEDSFCKYDMLTGLTQISNLRQYILEGELGATDLAVDKNSPHYLYVTTFDWDTIMIFDSFLQLEELLDLDSAILSVYGIVISG